MTDVQIAAANAAYIDRPDLIGELLREIALAMDAQKSGSSGEVGDKK